MIATYSRSPLHRRLLLAVVLLVLSLILAACGDGGGETTQVSTTTVTTAEAEAAAAGTTSADIEGSQTTESAAQSDAGTAIPDDQTAVEGAQPEVAPTETGTTTTATGEATAAETGTTTITTTDPNTGEVTTTTETTPLGTTTTTAPTATTLTPALSRDPVLPGDDDALLSRPFAADSPWNTPIAGDRVDPKSSRWMREARIRVARVEQNDGSSRVERRRIATGLTVNVTRWTVPVFSNVQADAVERIAVCRQFDCGPDAVSSVVIPADACPDPRYDGWMTVIDNDARTALDFWRARCEADGSISYHYVKKWELDGPGFQEPTGVSARGSGLPLFAGLITPQEIRDGQIEHALAISVPGAATRRYVQPASRTDGTGLPDSLPEGARIRLKPGGEKLLTKTFVRNGTERRTAAAIIAALERYGAIVVDRSAAPTLYAQRNANWGGILPLNLLQDIGLGQFEAVEAGPVFFDPPKAGEASFTPGSTGPASVPSTASGSQTTEFGDTSLGLAP